MTFEDWLEMANAVVIARTGMDRESFPDWEWWGAFDEGLTFSEASDMFLEDLYSGRL
jgi:hypothetical protein